MEAGEASKRKKQAIVAGIIGLVAVSAIVLSTRHSATTPSGPVSFEGPPKSRHEQIARINKRIEGLRERVSELESMSDADWQVRQQNLLKSQEAQRAKVMESITPEQKEQLRRNSQRNTSPNP